MRIGIPKEIKDHEYRVGATPLMTKLLVEKGHEVFVETNAGASIGFVDELYLQSGAAIVGTPEDVYDSDMVIKVKEPQKQEIPLLREGQILFGYLHLAPNPELARALLERKVIGIAYETVTDEHGHLPLLLPMSEIAGRIAIQAGATALQLNYGGKGIVLGGVPGVKPGKVVVIGGGIVGTEAARMAMGMGASVTVLDRDLNGLRTLDQLFGPRLHTLFSTPTTVEEAVLSADLVIGSVLIPGKSAPKLLTRDLVARMSPGSVIVDVAIDQGGCSETSVPTTHSDPYYVDEGIVHYCVTNMPGVCSRTATIALTNATLRYALKIAKRGYREALARDEHLRDGLNVFKGTVAHPAVAQDLGYEYQPF